MILTITSRVVIETIRDNTERKQMEDALHRQKEYLAALHETTLGLINHLNLQDLLQTLITRSCPGNCWVPRTASSIWSIPRKRCWNAGWG